MGFDRRACVEWFDRNRRRSRELFDSVVPDAYEARPIPLRNPICFYEGHLPAFNVNTLVKRGLRERGIDPDYEILFERGIDPEDESAVGRPPFRWPAREAIQAYGDRADQAIRQALLEKDVVRDDRPVLRDGPRGVHDARARADAPGDAALHVASPPLRKEDPPGRRGADRDRRRTAAAADRPDPGRRRDASAPRASGSRFGWDNEFPEHRVRVPGFEIDVFNVTNSDFMEFVEAGGYGKRELWDEEGWEWRARSSVEHPLFWERADGELVLARDVRAGSAASGLARLRHARGGVGLRPLEGEAAADRGGVPSRRLRHARRRASAPTRGETPSPTRRAATSTSAAPIRCRSAPFPPGASAWGVARSRRQRLGVDLDGLRRLCRDSSPWRRTPSTPPTSSTASTGS